MDSDNTNNTEHRPAELDQVLELNFVPQWARKPPDSSRYAEAEQRDRGLHAGGRGPRRDRDRSPSSGRGARPTRSRDDRDRRGRGDRPDRAVPHAREEVRPRADTRRAPFIEAAPVRVRFIPEQRQLSSLVRQLHATKMAYPLHQLAALLLKHRDSCYVKVEPYPEAQDLGLFQCKACRAASIDRAQLVAHVIHEHTQDYFVSEESEGEPPTGQFVCVARCGLSGELLGPPNHHTYAARLQEVHRTRYPDMAFDTYVSRVETVHDPEAIEKWREGCRKKTVYRLKEPGEGDAEPMEWAEMEAYLSRTVVPKLLVETRHASIPSRTAQTLQDKSLSRAISDAWHREQRYPRSLSLALRAALRHKRIHCFKVGRGMEFVTAIPPRALDPEHAVEPIRETLSFLQESPGCNRKDLLASLRPNAAPGSPEATEVLSPLGWLVEKGHIIEFFDGALSVPLSGRAGRRPPAAPAE